jgi:alkane 1-monooxygenase
VPDAGVEAGSVSADAVHPAPPADEVMAARCPSCSYTYEVDRGDEHEGFAAGTAWADIPDSWCCPDCGVREKVDFVAFDPKDRELAS